MNTNGLSKLYDRLTPAERLPLLIAASCRGDEEESQRLAQSSPQRTYSLCDHFALGVALQEAATFHMVAMLDRAAQVWQGWGFLACLQRSPRKITPEEDERLLGLLRWHAYLFKIEDEGWARFCAEQEIEPDALLDCIPGFNMLKQTREQVQRLAYSFEEATSFLRSKGIEGTPTVEAACQAWRDMLKQREAYWGRGKT